MRTYISILGLFVLVGCTTQPKKATNADIVGTDDGQVTYYDRNHDGHVDYEFHDYGCCDRNWALIDTDFDGRYDLRARWGYSFEKSPIDAAIATGVPMSLEEPEDLLR